MLPGRRCPRLLALLLLLLAVRCHGDEAASHLLLLEGMPEGIDPALPTPLVVRSNFSGRLVLEEGGEGEGVRVLVNVTAPTLAQAYRVQASLHHAQGALLLQLGEEAREPGPVSLRWLMLGAALPASLLLLLTLLYGACVFRRESSHLDFASSSERKSCASGSQPGLYRSSRNSVQLVAVPPPTGPGGQAELLLLAGGGPGGEEGDTCNPHNDDTLKRVPEMPEEEAAEAIEMEELKQQRYQEERQQQQESGGEDRKPPHSQGQALQPKELLLLRPRPRPPRRRRRTPQGVYTGVAGEPSSSGEASGDSDTEEGETGGRSDQGAPGPLEGALTRSESELSRAAPPGSQGNKLPLSVSLQPGQLQQGGQHGGRQEGGRPSLSRAEGVQHLEAAASPQAPPNLYSPFLQHVTADVHPPSSPQLVALSPPPPGGQHARHRPATSSPRLTTFSPSPPPGGQQPLALASFRPQNPRKVAFSDQEPRPGPEDGGGYERLSSLPRAASRTTPPGSQGRRGAPAPQEQQEEEEESGQSGSELSQSAYGSSEIFGGNLGEGRYLSLADSDPDLPPAALAPHPGSRTPRPPGQGSHAPRDPGDDSPPLPPPPEEFLTPGEAREGFSFPPPPAMLPQGQGQVRDKGQGQGAPPPEYVNLQARRPGDPRPGSNRGGGRKPGPRTLNLTLVTLTCVLGVVTGVWSSMAVRETVVHVTIFAPRHFLSNSTTVYFRLGRDADVDDRIGVPELNVYDVREPVLQGRGELQGHTNAAALCDVMGCKQGCDVKTGECICLRGFRLNEEGECVDVNECMAGGARCHRAAGCLNRLGSYDCVCDGLYYGDGKFCRECSAPCDAGEYERHPCSDGRQKICQACTTHCPEGSYMFKSCDLRSNALCRACSLKCQDDQFQVKSCTSRQNRECQDRATLPEPQASDNVMLEDMAKVKDETLEIPYLRPSEFIGIRRYKFLRGSGLTVDVRISHLEPLQLFVPLNATPPWPHAATPPHFAPSQFAPEVLERYCPHPVPNYHILHYTKHPNATYTRAGHRVEPCETWQRWGSFPDSGVGGQGQERGFLCAEPGPMTELFDIAPAFFWASGRWLERSKRCGNYSARCQACRRGCAGGLRGAQCAVRGDDSDNGWSPRLQLCLDCCLRSNCSQLCRNFHGRHCQPKMCEVGNLVEFKVQPKWDSSSRTRFFCHVTPLKRQWILELEYSVSHHSSFLHSGHVSLHGDHNWEQHGRMEFKDAILQLWVDSKLRELPDFLEGEVERGRQMFHVGRYRNTGSTVQSTVIGGESIFIRPSLPFSLDTAHINGRNHCDSSILQSALLAKKEEAPYVVDNDLMTLTYYDQKFPYIVTHEHAPPMLKIRLGAEVSVFGGIYPLGTLAPDSLKGDIRQNASHWTLTLTGELLDFPNRLVKVEVLDPGYPDKPLYRVEAVVGRPPNFRLTFALPSRDQEGVERSVLARVTDAGSVYSLLLYRPSSLEQQHLTRPPQPLVQGGRQGGGGGSGGQAGGSAGGEGRPLLFSSWALWAVCGAVLLLLCLAVVGMALAPGVPGPQAQNVRWHHVLLMTGYLVFHFLYSLALSFSAFALLLLLLNWERGQLVGQLDQLGRARQAAHQLELGRMAAHLVQELGRQQQQLEASRARCQADMQTVIADIGKLQDKVVASTEDVFEKQDIRRVFQQHALQLSRRLSSDLASFRKELEQYMRELLARLSRDVGLAVASVEASSWTSGARFLHGSVLNIRKNLHSMATLPFLQWAGLAPDMARLAVDPDLTLPPLPDFLSEPGLEPDPPQQGGSPPSKRASSPHITPHPSPRTPDFPRDVRVYNQWVYPLEPPPAPSAAPRRPRDGGSEGSGGVRWGVGLWGLLGALLAVDVLLFLHRMLSALSMAQLLLYGFPEYLDYRERSKAEETGNEEDDDVFGAAPEPQEGQAVQAGQLGQLGQEVERDTGHSCLRDCWCLVKFILWQVMSTLFIPKAVATVVVSLLVFYTLTASNQLLTAPALRHLGLLPDMDGLLELQAGLTNARLELQTRQGNEALYPALQTWMTSQLERHQFAFRQLQQQMHILQQVHNQTYCRHLELLGLGANCSHSNEEVHASSTVSTPGCQFLPLTARLYHRRSWRERRLVERQLETWLAELRALVASCCHLVAAFLALAVLKELVGATLWIYVRRSGAVRLRFIYETDEDQTLRSAE